MPYLKSSEDVDDIGLSIVAEFVGVITVASATVPVVVIAFLDLKGGAIILASLGIVTITFIQNTHFQGQEKVFGFLQELSDRLN
jgi:hypothetical protein